MLPPDNHIKIARYHSLGRRYRSAPYVKRKVTTMLTKFLTVCIVTPALAGCCNYMPSPPLWVEGVAPSDDQCELHLLVEGKVIDLIDISGKFTDGFFVSFCQKQYTLQAVCNGNVVYEANFKYPRDPTVPVPYNIGEISSEIKKSKGSNHRASRQREPGERER